MRLYDFEFIGEDGKPTGQIFEELVKTNTTELRFVDGRVARKRNFQKFACTPTRWGDSHAKFDKDLGCMVRGQHDVDRICKEKGLTPVEDLAPGTMQRCVQRTIDHAKHYEKVDARWDALVKKHGMYREDGSIDDAASIRVWEEHGNAKTILSGNWDGDIPFEQF